jgi:hypothetical protein
MDLIGALSSAAGGAAGEENLYIEDVFSTYLYTGTGAAQTITNYIDLDGEGGLVWIKSRNSSDYSHILVDSERPLSAFIQSNSTAVAGNNAQMVSSFNSDGFSIGGSGSTNASGVTYASWTFRKAPKFFDVVTYTGTGSARTVAHNLGSVPGCIIVKRTDNTGDWQVYHRANTANPETDYLVLNDTAATADSNTRWNDTQPTSTVFSLGTEATVNASGGTYVAYLWAHDAGGFGDDGLQNVVSCGSFTTDGSGNATVTLGYEPQWLMTKRTDQSFGNAAWYMFDSMRGWTATASGAGASPDSTLEANTTAVEDTASNYGLTTATGFTIQNMGSSAATIYIAIRRGPMKTPTAGTEVFGLNARTGTGANATVTGSAGVSDAVIVKNRGSAVASLFSSRLTGNNYLVTSTTAAQVAAGATILQTNPWDVMDGVKVGTTSTITNASANTFINYLFSRAPGFFDVVCYTGTGSATTISHNLGVAPELILVKRRSTSRSWGVYSAFTTATDALTLDGSAQAFSDPDYWNNTAPTSTVFTVNISATTNASGSTYIAYLFATLAGVSKVGSYTGTGTTLAIDCGFSAGARFVLIKRTDSTGDWYVWDTARGIVSGDDPYWLTNSANAEVTNTDYIDPLSSGFEISSTAPAAINASGGTFIFLAIA